MLRLLVVVALCLGEAACFGARSAYEPALSPARVRPPPPPPATGTLQLRVTYPPPSHGAVARAGDSIPLRADSRYLIQSRDSTFVFGTVGRGDAMLTVNGRAVPVYPTGGWIAWLPLPDDTVAVFDLLATAAGDTARMQFVAPLIARFVPPKSGSWIDTTSLSPTGDRWVRAGEGIRLSLVAAPDADVFVLLPDGRKASFHAEPTVEEVSWGARAFSTTAPGPDGRTGAMTRYVWWRVGALGPDPGDVMRPAPAPEEHDSSWIWVEAALGSDTLRTRWPLRLGVVDEHPPPVVVVSDDTAGTGATDEVVTGRPSPFGTYHWFFPNSTVAAVSGRWNDQVRLQLSRSSVAWVNASEVQPLARGAPPPRGTTRSIRLLPNETSVELRVPLPMRVPFRVDESRQELRLTLYGIAANMDWIQYGGTDPFVHLVSFAQPKEDEAQVVVDLAQPVWGYRTRWEANDLILDIRRPPIIDPARPLAGRLIALDPGHPPLGATGPTGLREPDVVLAVAEKAAELLERHGARVVLIRNTDAPVELVQRVVAAERANAEVLVSIHANALPDGVNPFVNSGTSVYYFHPRSALLARVLNRALVRQFGFRDLGMGRGDLALARPTWMPAALTEGLFMMLPDQEAVLASQEGQLRYAEGLVEGIAAFLRLRAIGAAPM